MGNEMIRTPLNLALIALVTLAFWVATAHAQIGCKLVEMPSGKDSVAIVGFKGHCLFVEAVTGQKARLETTTEPGVNAEVEGQRGYVSSVSPRMEFIVVANRVVIRLSPNPMNSQCLVFDGRLTLEGGGPEFSRDDLRRIGNAIWETRSMPAGTVVSDKWTPEFEASARRMLAAAGLPETIRGEDLVQVASAVSSAAGKAFVEDGDYSNWPKYFHERTAGTKWLNELLADSSTGGAAANEDSAPPAPNARLAADLRALVGLAMKTEAHPLFPDRLRAVVVSVEPGSAASQVNLRSGMRIIDIEGKKVVTADDVARILLAARGQAVTILTAGECADVSHPITVPTAVATSTETDQLPRVLFPMATDAAFMAIYRNELEGANPYALKESAFRILEGIAYEASRCLPPDAVAIPMRFTSTSTMRDGLGNIRSEQSTSFDEEMRVSPEFAEFTRANVGLALDSTWTAVSATRQTVAKLAGQGGCEGEDLMQLLRGVAMVAGVPSSRAEAASGDASAARDTFRDWRSFAQDCYGEMASSLPNANQSTLAHMCICTEEALAAMGDSALYSSARESMGTTYSALSAERRAELDAATREVCPTPETPLNGTREDVADRYRTFVREAGLE